MVTSTRGEVTRYTDRETMDHFLMAYRGLANKRLVEALRARGADAVGLAAMDGGIATGRRKPDLRIAEGGRQRLLHDNHAGTLERVDVSLLRLLLDSGRLPCSRLRRSPTGARRSTSTATGWRPSWPSRWARGGS